MIFLTFRGLFTGWHQVTVSAHHQGPPDAAACQGNSKISSHHRPHCCTKGTNHIAMPVMMTATNFTDVLPHPHLVRSISNFNEFVQECGLKVFLTHFLDKTDHFFLSHSWTNSLKQDMLLTTCVISFQLLSLLRLLRLSRLVRYAGQWEEVIVSSRDF